MHIGSDPDTLSPEKFFDRRGHPRYRFNRVIEIQSKGTVVPAMTIEISATGASVASPAQFISGELVQMECFFGEGPLSAVVRRNIGHVYGLEFIGLTEAQSREIASMCTKLQLYTASMKGI